MQLAILLSKIRVLRGKMGIGECYTNDYIVLQPNNIIYSLYNSIMLRRSEHLTIMRKGRSDFGTLIGKRGGRKIL